MSSVTASFAPNLSYREVFQISLKNRGELVITLADGDSRIELEGLTGSKTFIDQKDAGFHCDHEGTDKVWRQGWLEGLDEARSMAGAVAEVLADWHYENHAGPAQFCAEQPCHGIGMIHSSSIDSWV